MALTAGGLAKLAEECGELIQVIGKKLAYYTTQTHPDNNTAAIGQVASAPPLERCQRWLMQNRTSWPKSCETCRFGPCVCGIEQAIRAAVKEASKP